MKKNGLIGILAGGLFLSSCGDINYQGKFSGFEAKYFENSSVLNKESHLFIEDSLGHFHFFYYKGISQKLDSYYFSKGGVNGDVLFYEGKDIPKSAIDNSNKYLEIVKNNIK